MPTKAQLIEANDELQERIDDLENRLYRYALKSTRLITHYEMVCNENGLEHKIKNLGDFDF